MSVRKASVLAGTLVNSWVTLYCGSDSSEATAASKVDGTKGPSSTNQLSWNCVYVTPLGGTSLGSGTARRVKP